MLFPSDFLSCITLQGLGLGLRTLCLQLPFAMSFALISCRILSTPAACVVPVQRREKTIRKKSMNSCCHKKTWHAYQKWLRDIWCTVCGSLLPTWGISLLLRKPDECTIQACASRHRNVGGTHDVTSYLSKHYSPHLRYGFCSISQTFYHELPKSTFQETKGITWQCPQFPPSS